MEKVNDEGETEDSSNKRKAKVRENMARYRAKRNKHCEILVSCSDEGRNCMQSCVTACKLRELHASSGNCMQAHATACKLMQLHASSCNCMQAYVTACKLM